MAKGFLYIARNDAMPGLLKIGRTERIPDTRMSELFSTGVPEPFEIIYYALTSNAKADEVKVHQVLSRFRHRENREFFAIESVSAIGAIMHLCDIEHDWKHSDVDASARENPSRLGARQAINTCSRHGVEGEENELAEFVRALNVAVLEVFVISAFYDSNACLCNIELAEGVDEYSVVAGHIHAIAKIH